MKTKRLSYIVQKQYQEWECSKKRLVNQSTGRMIVSDQNHKQAKKKEVKMAISFS